MQPSILEWLAVMIVSIMMNLWLYLPAVLISAEGNMTWVASVLGVATFLTCGLLLAYAFLAEMVDEFSARPGC
jgi:hypothetical protein